MKWETQEWLTKKYIPELILLSSNQLYLGLLVGDAIFSVASVKNIMVKTSSLEGLKAKVFSNFEDCKAWINEIPVAIISSNSMSVA